MYFCVGTDISAEAQPIGMKFRMMIDMGLGQVFFPLGEIPKSCPKIRKFDCKYLENVKSQRYMSDGA